MSQPSFRENWNLASRWGISVGATIIAATAGLSEAATAQGNPPTRLAQRTMTVNAEVVSPQEAVEKVETAIPVIPPSSFFQPRRLSLSDILVLEPNLDPEQSRVPQPLPGYKVVVAAQTTTQAERVRALVPQAFRTQYKGQMMLQVGLFRDRANAEQIRQALSRNGLRAIIVNL